MKLATLYYYDASRGKDIYQSHPYEGGREQSISASQVLHMMAVENKAPHLSHRYHVYVTVIRA